MFPTESAINVLKFKLDWKPDPGYNVFSHVRIQERNSKLAERTWFGQKSDSNNADRTLLVYSPSNLMSPVIPSVLPYCFYKRYTLVRILQRHLTIAENDFKDNYFYNIYCGCKYVNYILCM